MDNLKEELKTYVQNHINERIRLEELEKNIFSIQNFIYVENSRKRQVVQL